MDNEETHPTTAVQSQTVEYTAPQPGHVQTLAPGSGESNGVAERDTLSQTSSTQPLNPTLEGRPTGPHPPENPYADFERVPVAQRARVSSRRQAFTSNGGFLVDSQNVSAIDWIVPVQGKGATRLTIGERLQPTIKNAVVERNKYARQALLTSYALNVAIGLQVLLGALTTALAAALSSGKQAQISTAILGGLSTLVASYMARARGSGEPELSITRVKDLEQFLREARAFQLDHTYEYGTFENGLNDRLECLRRKFEELLGNANGERKLSPVGITPTQAVP